MTYGTSGFFIWAGIAVALEAFVLIAFRRQLLSSTIRMRTLSGDEAVWAGHLALKKLSLHAGRWDGAFFCFCRYGCFSFFMR